MNCYYDEKMKIKCPALITSSWDDNYDKCLCSRNRDFKQMEILCKIKIKENLLCFLKEDEKFYKDEISKIILKIKALKLELKDYKDSTKGTL